MMTRRRAGIWLSGWKGLLVASSAGATPAPRKPVLVFAASSLTNVVDELDQAFTAGTGIPVKASYAASSALAKQIEAGAPADVFFSADTAWVDYLDPRKLLKPGSRRDVVANRLVLIAPEDSHLQIKIAPHFTLAGALGDGKLATGDPDSVPVGKYAQAALQKLGAWDAVSSHIVRAENVRSALEFVARGEAALGIVYATDAAVSDRVEVLATFPEETHDPVVYPFALVDGARPEARAFLDYLSGPTAKGVFTHYGFILKMP